jgi:DNA-binding HxlR family transcriptional regulator
MAKKVSPQDCHSHILPIKDTLEIISGKWKIFILISITHGNKRFMEIERSIPKITGKVLAKELKELEMNDLIKRTVYDSTPVTIEYEATPYAATLQPVIDALKTWGENHRKRIINKSKKKVTSE